MSRLRSARGAGALQATAAAAGLPVAGLTEVVAIDPSAAFGKALCQQLPAAAVSVDPLHLVKLADDVVPHVRQRVVREAKGRRGRSVDPAWANRRLLPRAGNTLSPRPLARLEATLRADEIGAAWGRRGTAAPAADQRPTRRGRRAQDAPRCVRALLDMPETDRLWATLDAWWDAIEVLIVTGVTNARSEAANSGIKQIKRTGPGYQEPREAALSARPHQSRRSRTAASTSSAANPATDRWSTYRRGSLTSWAHP